MALQSATIDFSFVLGQVYNQGLFKSLCTIKQPPNPDTPGALGQVDWTAFTPVAGLSNILCMRSVLAIGRPQPNYAEMQPDLIRLEGIFHVLLYGYFPSIQQKWQAVVDGEPLDILNVEHDSQKIMTRLAVRRYAV